MNSTASSEPSCCATLELRQYTLKPGQRDLLIDLFDQHLVESQEALGMAVLGQFRDRRRADRFVWIRGFADMNSRHAALEQFYGGPEWATHSAAANATMLEFSDVLLLRPARPDMAFRLNRSDRPARGEKRPAAVVLAGIHPLREPADPAIVSLFERRFMPALRESGVDIDGTFVTEPASNTFTRLPVREGEHVLVWFGTLARLTVSEGGWWERLTSGVSSLGDTPPILLELDPTTRSILGHHRAGP